MNTESAGETQSSKPLPNSSRVYIGGTLHPNVRVPMREIALSPTKTFSGELEANEPVRVYDTSGPWGDPAFEGDVERGLPALRKEWILNRKDVAEYDGRDIKPQDNGYLSTSHAQIASEKRGGLSALSSPENAKRRPLKANGHPVTQLWYARQGIITPEMEFIAIRENLRAARLADYTDDIVRNDLDKQHAGSSQQSTLNSQASDFTPSVFRRFPQRIP
ncbi:MAG: phosphomethylpyrimidine synthase, partial [Verrucomicrobiota bacterium]